MAYRLRGMGGFEEPWLPPGHTDIRIVGERPNAKSYIEVDWEHVKEKNPDYRTLTFGRFNVEYLFLMNDPQIWAVRERLVKAGKVPPEDPEEVKSSFLVQLSWAWKALQGWANPKAAVRVKFYEQRLKDGLVREYFTMYPDGTMEKSEEMVKTRMASLVPLGNVMAVTYWGARMPDNELRFGEDSRNMPKEKYGL